MKGKLNAKTIIIGLIITILLGVATTGVVVFLRDSGEARAMTEGDFYPQNSVVDSSEQDVLEQSTNSIEETAETNNEEQADVDGEATLSEESDTLGAEEENDSEAYVSTTTIVGGQQPATTTVEQERLVSEETKLNWSNIPLATNPEDYNSKDINYNNLRYKVEYYYDGVIDESQTDVIGDNKVNDEITEYIDKIKPGYEFVDATIDEENPLIITIDEEKNIIKVYYEKPIFRIEKTSKIEKAQGNKVKDKAELGDTIKYTITVYNEGNVPLNNIVVTDEKLGREETITVTVEEGKKVAIEEEYVVTQTDINNQEALVNVAIAKLYDQEDSDDETIEVVDEDKTFEIEKKAVIEKAQGNIVKNKAELDDTIKYTITVYNKGNVDLKGIKVTDEKLEKETTVDVTVAEGKKIAIEADYIVTQDDINKQEDILNTAVAKLDDVEDKDNEDVPVVKADKTFEIEKKAVIEKTQGNTVTNKAELGDTIKYTITVYNKGNVDLKGIVVTDEKLEREETIDITVAEGKKVAIEADYVVTQDDINKQEDILNTAVAKLDGKTDKDTEEVPVVKAEPEVNIQKDIIALTVGGVTTNLENVSVDNIKTKQGDTITYKIIATNTGNTTLSKVKITDDKKVTLNTATLPSRLSQMTITTGNTINANSNLLGRDDITLEPQESITLTVSYTLQKSDVVGTHYQEDFVNTAKITGTYNNKQYKEDDDATIGTDYTLITCSKTFVKEWNDTGYENCRPDSVKIQLYKNSGVKVGNEVKIDATNNWTHVFSGLYLEDTNGNTINYYVEEVEVPTGYTASNCTIKDGKMTITNSYTKPTGTVVKNWTTESTTEVPVPIDVVFVIDTSGSMMDGGSTRASDMVTALNSAMHQILSYNSYNRVSVVGFSESGTWSGTVNPEDAEVLLTLGRYTATNNEYFKLDGRVLSTNVTQLSTQNTRNVEQGTYTQAGIELGANQLIGSSEKTVTINGEAVKRTPVIILLSDGEPSFYTTSYNNVSAGPKLGQGLLTADILPNGRAEYGYYTILTANYYKKKVTNAYNNSAKVFTIAMDMDATYGTTVLNPTQANVTACANSSDLIAKNLYEYLTNGYNGKSNPYSNYSYADDAYKGGMNATTLSNIMKKIVTSVVPNSQSWSITETQINSAKVELPDIDIAQTFTIKVDSLTKYSSCAEATTAGVLQGNSTDGYYINLAKLGELAPGTNISIIYIAK